MGIFIAEHSTAVHCGHARSEMRSKPFFRGVSTPWNLAFLDIKKYKDILDFKTAYIDSLHCSAQFRSKIVLIHNFSSLTRGLYVCMYVCKTLF